MRKKIAAGNWKMNGTQAALAQIKILAKDLPPQSPDVIICPPAPLLIPATHIAGPIAIGAQDCHVADSGAYTGDVSAAMVADTGAQYIIVGHSERRDAHHETDADVRAKAEAAWANALTAIICIGEALGDREADKTLDVIGAQLSGSLPDGVTAANTVVAYEPIWAIGTGKVPTQEQIIEVHDFIRTELTHRFGGSTADDIPLLYGGSVKAGNAATIFAAQNVDGALVGGASLQASDFAPIIAALAAS